MDLSQFDYFLPEQLIANRPCSPRQCSRMLVGSLSLKDDKFINFPKYIGKNDLVIINSSKVIPILLEGSTKKNKVSITLHKEIDESIWLAYAKPGKKISTDSEIVFSNNVKAKVLEKMGYGEIKINFNCKKEEIEKFLEEKGKMPLPPYILKKRESDPKDFIDYQTVYAREVGSIAAPTAGLHFDENIFQKLKINNQIAEVTLHVGAGTFQPIRGDINEHKMHSEYGVVTQETVAQILNCKKNGGKVISVGTTTLRLLETASLEDGQISSFEGDTDIFIKPGFKFKTVDILLTNFHLPESTLLLLVCAFAGKEKIMDLYKSAVDMKYRFFSYGDVTLLYKK
jgi:S-adenosylmethionine:tRNA ribosyltransferase-isomerase